VNRKRILLILMAAVCILLAVFLAAGAVLIYREGMIRKAADPLENVYTPEEAVKVFAAAVPLFLAFLALLVICLAVGVKDPEADRPKGPSGPVKPAAESKQKTMIQAAVVVAAVALIIAGILNGSAGDVLIKAIHICTECIGLG
jgi:hypothetical protein